VSNERFDMAANICEALEAKLDLARGTEDELEAQMNLVKANQVKEDVLASTEKRLATLLRTQDLAAQYENSIAKYVSDDIKGANVDLQKNIDKRSLGTSMAIQFVSKVTAYCSTRAELSLTLNVLTECPFTGKQVKPLHSGNLLLIWNILLEKFRDKGNKAKVMVKIVNTIKHHMMQGSGSLRPRINGIEKSVVELQDLDVYNLSISDLLGAICISLSDEECLKYYQSTIEILELSENSGKGEHSQLGQNKVGDDGREAPNLMPILKHMCEMQIRNQFMNKSVKEFKTASNKSTSEKSSTETTKQEAKEQKVLTVTEQTAMITKAVHEALKIAPNGSGGGGAAKDSRKDKTDKGKSDTRSTTISRCDDDCYNHREGKCPYKHTSPSTGKDSKQKLCDGWIENNNKNGICAYGEAHDSFCNRYHPARPGKPDHKQASPSFKGKRTGGEKIEIITVDPSNDPYCDFDSPTAPHATGLGPWGSSPQQTESGVSNEFGSGTPNNQRGVPSTLPNYDLDVLNNDTHSTIVYMDFSQIPRASAAQEATFSREESIQMISDSEGYEIELQALSAQELGIHPIQHLFQAPEARKQFVDQMNNTVMEGSTTRYMVEESIIPGDELLSIVLSPSSHMARYERPVPQADSSIFEQGSTLHILYEHLYAMTVPTRHLDNSLWDCGSTLYAAPSAAMLHQPSLSRLEAPLIIRGATGTAPAVLIGHPKHLREALCKETIVIPGLQEHIYPLGRATHANSDGHRSIFLLTDIGGRHILLSDPHIKDVLAKFLTDVQRFVIGTAEQVNYLYREFHSGPGFDEAQREYSAHLTARVNTMSLVPEVSGSISSDLDKGLSMSANTRYTKTESSST